MNTIQINQAYETVQTIDTGTADEIQEYIVENIHLENHTWNGLLAELVKQYNIVDIDCPLTIDIMEDILTDKNIDESILDEML